MYLFTKPHTAAHLLLKGRMRPYGRRFPTPDIYHCFFWKPRAFSTRFVVLFLAYKTLSIDRNHLKLAISSLSTG